MHKGSHTLCLIYTFLTSAHYTYISVVLCHVYFYSLISNAALTMQQAVLHGKCIAGAGLLHQGLAHFLKKKV